MTELKAFLESTFMQIRTKIEEEKRYQLTGHYESLTSKIDSAKFTAGYGELRPNPRLPKALPDRWWIHIGTSNTEYYIYDNFGQAFKRGFGNNLVDPSQNGNFGSCQQEPDPKYQYPLPDSLIDFVKKQNAIEDLHLLADSYHQILYVFTL